MQVELIDVKEALGGDQLIPFFQPVVELRTGNIRGFEVLARWQHPQHGPVLPTNFISLAEDNGLVGTVMSQVCGKAFRVLNLLPEPLTLAINVSPIQMRDRSLPQQIRTLAESAHFPLRRLIVEITESALLHDVAMAQQIAGELKAMGCRLALDDFGTGYSSLLHLQSLGFHELKIDRCFVAAMTTVRDNRKIVAAMIGLGHSLGLDTIAEGVETEEQADMLMWLGCEQVQGWRYGRPASADKISAMLAAEPVAVSPGLTGPGEDWASSSLEALPTLRLAQLQAIYDGAPVGLCFLDCQLRYVNLNGRLAEMNGLSVRAHLGRAVKELFPQWFPTFEPYLMRALQGEAISSVEFHRPGLNSDDAGRDLIASYQPAWDEADEVIGISISLLDVTEPPLSELPKGGSGDIKEFVFEVNPEVPWVMDAEGNNLQVSSRWVQTTPLGKDRTRNLRWLEALHADDLESTIKVMKHALLTGHPIDIEYRVLGEGGEWRWMRSTGSPRFAATGEITRWYGSVEDIHDRKLRELKLLEQEKRQNLDDQDVLAKGMLVSGALQHSMADSDKSFPPD